MTYPKVTTNDEAGRSAAGGVPSTPRFPEIEQRVLKVLEQGSFLAPGLRRVVRGLRNLNR